VVAFIVYSLIAAGRLDRPESCSGRRPAALGSGTVAGLGRTAREGVGFRSRRPSYTASEGAALEMVPTGTAATAGT
jgi:hypothetical protein